MHMLLDRVNDRRAILDWMALQLQDTKKQALLEEAAEKKAEASTVLTGLRSAIQGRQLCGSPVLLDNGADVNGGGYWRMDDSNHSCHVRIQGTYGATAGKRC